MNKIVNSLLFLFGAFIMYSCSNNKNTGMTRAVQAFKARYNTYYNGHVAYLDGCLAQENGNKDNYTDIILFTLQEIRQLSASVKLILTELLRNARKRLSSIQ